jgi:hypothetical protein
MIDPAAAPGPVNVQARGVRSAAFEIVVDAEAPAASFGDLISTIDGLHPSSDSSVPGIAATITDRVTNDTTPTFWGTAEANTIVRAYLDVDASGTINGPDLLLGQATAIPTDGSDQAPFGQWSITSTIDMNSPVVLTAADISPRRTATNSDFGGRRSRQYCDAGGSSDAATVPEHLYRHSGAAADGSGRRRCAANHSNRQSNTTGAGKWHQLLQSFRCKAGQCSSGPNSLLSADLQFTCVIFLLESCRSSTRPFRLLRWPAALSRHWLPCRHWPELLQLPLWLPFRSLQVPPL